MGASGHRARRFELHGAGHLARCVGSLSGNSGPALDDDRLDGVARFEHTLLLLSTGKAIAAGGRSSTTGTTGLTSAELYDPTSGTWSPTGSMANARRLHTMTQLGSSSNGTTSGKVLVAGGISGTTSTNSAELYSPSAGTWIAAGNLDVARHAHTATLLADGRVLAAGGLNGTSMLTTAALYNPASGAGTWVSTTGPVPPGGIKNHTATLIQTTNTQLNNHVLLVGGNNGTSTISAVYLFDPVQNAFSTLASIPSPPREQHTAVTLTNTNGKILVAGGKNGSTVLASAIVFDPSFSNGTWSSAGTMNSPRVGHSMTQLPSSIVANGQLLVAGGSSTGSDTLASAELFSGTSTWTVTPSMPGPLQNQQAVLLGGNMVLVAGGLSTTGTVQNAAYLYDASFGLGCTTNSQCSSGFCSAGICCNTACSGTCGACNLAGHLGTCTALTSGTVCRAAAGACDVAETCDGTALTCPADALAPSTTVCRAAAGECDAAETCTGTSASCPADSKKASGTACTDDGNPCTQDTCDGSAITCQHPVGNAGTVCRASAGACDVAETCTGTSATCPADGFATASTVCRAAGGECDLAETCTGTSASCPADSKKTSGTACTDDGNVCTKDQCDGSNVLCQHPAGNAGTVCRGSTGICDVAEVCTGTSTTCPADGKAPNGTTCSDGNACTTGDSCQSGTCTGTAVTCTAQDQCHTAGTCNPSTGVCSNPVLANGTTCSDGNACTTGDSCQSGTCTGTAVTCTAQDQCHSAGTCNQSTGVCSNPVLANGTTCSDGNACTTGDSCQSGTCTGTAVTCTAQDQCHSAGTCNQSTGVCSNPVLANGTTCSDGNACTTGDSCQSGTCTGTAVTCTAQDQCHSAGTCNQSTGVCSNPVLANGTTCSDGNACTTGDSCQSGTCTGTAVTCTAQDQCHSAGTCNQSTGVCSNPVLANGTTCSDGNACTTGDSCQSGTCTGTAVTCTAQDQCHSAGTCNQSTGVCSNPPVANGTTCNDNNACTTADSCQSGTCTGTTVTCTAQDQCHAAGTCDPSSGLCTNPTKSNGASCDDGNACTTGDSCQAGSCVSGTSTCVALTVTQTDEGFGTAVQFDAGNSFSASVPSAVPGDSVTFTVTLTNTGAFMRANAGMQVTNNGTVPFVWGSYQVTMEYQSPVTGEWTAIAKTSFDASGVQSDAPPLLHMNIDNFVGTTIAPNQTVNLDSTENVTLPADLINLLGDPAEVSQVRVELHIDTGSGTSGVTADRDITGSFTDGQTTATNFGSGVMGFASNDVTISVPLTPSTTVVPPGEAVTFTGTAAAPPLDPRQPDESDFQYLRRLPGSGYEALLHLDTFFTGNDRIFFALLDPVLNLQKSGPAQGNAGFTLPYTVALKNVGTATAGPITIVDLVNGIDVGAQVTAPASLAIGGSGTASVNAASPLGQAPGAYTDQASLTWKDRNGTVYGPISSTFTTNLAAGHPEGYLSLVATGVGGPQIIGTPVTLTATALDALGHPVANLPVQLAIAGSNAQSTTLVTGSDGTASFTYDGPTLGRDTATATAVINGPTVQATAPTYTWASSDGPPCTGRTTPLDVMLLVDGSPSMFTNDTVAAAQVAADGFVGDLNPDLDQVAAVFFNFDAELAVPFTSDAATADAGINQAFVDFANACGGFCPPDSTDYPSGFQTAIDELQGPRHRPGATPLMVFLSDGGNTGADPSPYVAQLRAAGVRIISLGFGPNTNVPLMKQIASSTNDYFYAPTTGELGWALRNIVGDACRTIPPLVSGGGNQGIYSARLPDSLTLNGEIHGSGPQGDFGLIASWSEVSGPGPVTFVDPSSPTTSVVFSDPGTYVLKLEVSDGQTTTAQLVTITVDPAPSLTGASLVLAPSSPGPLTIGTPETVTATLIDAQSHPIGNFVVQVAVTGANPTVATLSTNAAGVATFTYAGAMVGTDTVQATAIGGTAQLQSTPVSIVWTGVPPVGSAAAQGWIGSPATQTTVMGLVPIKVASGVTVTSGTLSYWPSTKPTDMHVLTTTAAGGPGATLATLDTTVLSNGTYIIDLDGTDDHGNQQDSEVLVTVAGDYKPGRVVVDVPEFTIPVAGIPISIGRRYDSLEREKVGDFGNGWSLQVGHPDLQVDQGNNVTITMPNGRRATFQFEIQPEAVGAIVLGFIAQPIYVPEPGVFGTLTSDGCNLLAFDPSNPNPICFASLFDPDTLNYAPTTYKYTDPYGVVYTMGVDGTLQSIQDRNNNVLTFTADGITSPVSGQTVSFTRDVQGRITAIVTPPVETVFNTRYEYDYAYDPSGNLVSDTRPAIIGGTNALTYTYDGDHRLLTSVDPTGHAARTSTYDDTGRLATDTDALGNVTRYAYDLSGHVTTTTFPDSGVLAQTFDDQGLLLSQTDQLGRTTQHQYDANRNEVKRTNALSEVTTYTYDANGNQTSSTNALGEVTATTYNAFSEPLTTTNPIGNTTTIAYDGQGLPTSFTDSMGPLATFTSAEHGQPITVTDAAGNTVYLGYDVSGDLTARTDRLGRATLYSFDGIGRKVSMTTPLAVATTGAKWTYDYDQRNELADATDPINSIFGTHRYLYDENGNTVGDYFPFSGNSFNYTYDPLNHLTLTQYGDGSTTQYTRDFRGNALTQTDEVGNLTSYTYDLAGQLVQTIYADGTSISQGYDSLGRLTSKTDERGGTTTYAYEPGCDCTDRMTSVTDPLGRTTSMTYDGMSRKTSTTDASSHQTFYVYDLRGHLIETDYADGTATHDTYDALGRRTASKDQTGATTHYGYDAEGQLISVTDPLANLTQYAYDADGNLSSLTDANGHVTTYAYDLLDEKTQRTLPLGMSETFTYDPLGEQRTHTDFRGKTTTMTYDPRKRLLSKVPDPSLNEPTVSYAYNLDGTRTQMKDASGTTTYGYDNRSRLLTKATPEGTLTYTYDASGNVASIDSSNTNGTSVAYAWDPANQLVSVTDNRLGGMSTAAYTATGRPASLAQPNGVNATYGYDSLDQVTSMAWKKGAAATLASWTYAYSPRGQRLTSTDVTGREATYGYDTASRLTSETITGDPSGEIGNGALTYSIDPFGNRLSRASTLAALTPQSFGYDANDELTSDIHDQNGNTTASGGHTYGYDFENRLVSRDGGSVTILYDGDGNRVTKAVGAVTTKYLVDELNPTGYLQVMDEVSGGSVQVRYTFGNMLVSQTRDPSTTSATSFYGYDAHRSIAFLTDATGAVTDTYTYDAWGILVAQTGATANSRLYAGEEFDSDLGLINMRARQYKASTARFVSADSLFGNRDLPLSLNRYLYANGDPIDGLDPSGHLDAEENAVILGGIAVGVAATIIIQGKPVDYCLVGAGGAGAYMAAVVASGPVGLAITAAFATICLMNTLPSK